MLPWRLDGCNSSPRLTLSRIVSGRCRPDIQTVAAVFPYLCLWRKFYYLLNTDWRSDGIATSSGRMHLNAGFFWNFEERSDMLPWRPDVCKLELIEALDTDGRPDGKFSTSRRIVAWLMSVQMEYHFVRTDTRDLNFTILNSAQSLLEAHKRSVDSEYKQYLMGKFWYSQTHESYVA
jgi:hypothetical protein